MTRASTLRYCPLCGNPTRVNALVEAHVGPTRQHPKADVVVWLCPPCAQEVSDPGLPRRAGSRKRRPPLGPRPYLSRRGDPGRLPPLPACPMEGPGGWARTRNPPRGRTRPPPPTHPAWREVNRMRRPSLEELQRQLEEDGGCEATDGCFVEPDGCCEHGQPSCLLALGLI